MNLAQSLWFKSFGLRARLVILILLALTSGSALFAYRLIETRNGAISAASVELLASARLMATESGDLIGHARSLMAVLATLPDIRGLRNPECSAIVARVLKQDARYSFIGVVDADAMVTCSAVPLTKPVSVLDRAWFKRVAEMRDFVVGGYAIGRGSGKRSIHLAYPLLSDSGEFSGAINVAIDLDGLNRRLSGLALPPNRTVAILDPDGTVLAAHGWLAGSTGRPTSEQFINVVKQQREGVTEISPTDNNRHLFAFTPLGGLNQASLIVALGASRDDLLREANKGFVQNLLALLAVTAAVFAATWYGIKVWVLQPVRALVGAAQQVSAGDLSTRIGPGYPSAEIGQVARAFDNMTQSLATQVEMMRRAEGEIRALNANLEQRILERTNALEHAQAQLEHLSLLDQITRSTGERLDLKSIFQIVLNRLEDSLPVDFGCVCLYDPVANTLRVTCVGAKSAALARELTLDEQAAIDIDENGLSRCIQGHLVYEPDVSQVRFPFPARLARGGLGSLVMAPLKSESRVFGVLIAARRAAQAFSSAECEFLRQLSEHVALAAHQAQLYTSLQQAYDDLHQTQQAMMQEERLRALGQMASGIAHDINNALSPVSLYVESLLEKEPDLSARARGYLETIQRAVEDVAQTVARMREFYRKREQQLELTPVQMNSMVQQVLDLTRARWRDMPQSRGIVIRALTELAPDLPEVMGVESEIREALTNLVFNAVDAMPEGGTLTLRTRVADANPQHPTVAVEVIDTGAGMDEDTRRRCLEPFFTTKGERGTGLGLAMVFGMVQRHSAEVEIDSAPGAGTTVRLVFAVPAAVQTETGQPARALEVPSRLRLLLIDDDPILLKALQDTLQTDGHVIVTANGGEAGIAAFRASLERGETFAAVITDLGMPYFDGRQVAAAVKAASRATPVIMLTGWGQRLIADNDIPLHVDRVLAKPPKLRDLREALALLCPGPQRTENTA